MNPAYNPVEVAFTTKQEVPPDPKTELVCRGRARGSGPGPAPEAQVSGVGVLQLGRKGEGRKCLDLPGRAQKELIALEAPGSKPVVHWGWRVECGC